MQAKEKSLSDLAGFNTDFKLEVDNNLPKIEVVPQEIECVLLNLINNAFYAVQAPPLSRSELGTGSGGGIRETGKNYKPLVIARTASFIPPTVGPTRPDDPVGRGGAVISVTDNGPGIPDSIKDKIVQSFFTTNLPDKGPGLD